jgi:hypothetical protein
MCAGVLAITALIFLLAAAPAAAQKRGSVGHLNIDLSSILGNNLAGCVELQDQDGNTVHLLEVPEGALETDIATGKYTAYVYVYAQGAPMLVKVQEIEIAARKPNTVLLNLLEGADDLSSLFKFDADGDLSLDRVELDAGTNPHHVASIPGRRPVPYPQKVLSEKAGWYRGELYAHSKYGRGKESVAKLVKRAEKRGLDFLAITDMNTMAAVYDSGFKSDKVVLIPAMAWGNPENGTALIYGPLTVPAPPGSLSAAQAECFRVQRQGGVFTIAHPCFPDDPWQWGVSYVNAIQVWCGGWRSPPPITLNHLRPEYHIAEDGIYKSGRSTGKLVYSIAAAANASVVSADAARISGTRDLSVSANWQSSLFWDYELDRGLLASPIAGSDSDGPDIPLGAPVTYVYALQKSVAGILDALRMGHTFVSSDLNGPRLQFNIDTTLDDKTDISMGGVIPLGKTVVFQVQVFDAKGKMLHVLRNGRPMQQVTIDSNRFE